MKVNLIGQTYIDHIFNIDDVVYGDTNKLDNVTSNLGGIYNISKNVPIMDYNHITTGKTEATIINDIKKSIRTSFTRRISNVIIFEKFPHAQWTHIAYLDDIEFYNKIKPQTPYSIDFCTTQDRIPYLEIMKNSDLIFDSRERSYLYKSINIDTPIILHEPNRIDCIINNELSCSIDIEPIKNISVNGAGDIFAGYFIFFYYKDHSLIDSMKKASKKTKIILKGIRDEKI